MLLGQDLGRRHERGLGAVLGRDQHRETRDHRLARSDVALKQAGHRAAGAQIVGDLAHRPLLGVRQRKRKDVTRELLDRLLRRQHPAGAVSQPRAPILDPGGEGQQLLVRQLRQRRLRGVRVRRKVGFAERVPQPGGRRADRAEIRSELVERAAHERPPLPRRDVGDAVVDPDDPARVERIRLVPGIEQLRLGVLDAHLAASPGDRGAEQRRPPAFGGERFREGRVPVVPEDADRAGAVVGDRLDAQEPAAHPGGTHALEAHEHGRRPLPLQARHRREPPAVFVPEGHGEKEVGDGSEAGFGEPRGPGGPDPGQVGDRLTQAQLSLAWDVRGASASVTSRASGRSASRGRT